MGFSDFRSSTEDRDTGINGVVVHYLALLEVLYQLQVSAGAFRLPQQGRPAARDVLAGELFQSLCSTGAEPLGQAIGTTHTEPPQPEVVNHAAERRWDRAWPREELE